MNHVHMAPVVMNLEEWNRQLELVQHPQRQQIMEYLTHGVDIGITANHYKPRFCSNLISAQGEGQVEKISEEMKKETSLGRRAGPFSQIPFFNFQCSPIGTVPKSGYSNKLRVIHHLLPEGSKRYQHKQPNQRHAMRIPSLHHCLQAGGYDGQGMFTF
jgi:hypothetical protein